MNYEIIFRQDGGPSPTQHNDLTRVHGWFFFVFVGVSPGRATLSKGSFRSTNRTTPQATPREEQIHQSINESGIGSTSLRWDTVATEERKFFYSQKEWQTGHALDHNSFRKARTGGQDSGARMTLQI